MLVLCTLVSITFEGKILKMSIMNYDRIDIDLGHDQRGEIKACLFKSACIKKTSKAVLYVHGYMDFFFHDHVAKGYNDAGYDFYAIELRRYGRAIMPHQRANYTTDVKEYFEELDYAVDLIRNKEHHDHFVLLCHSTGCLTGILYAKCRQHKGEINSLILNSPFLDFSIPKLFKVLLPVFSALGKIFPGGYNPLPDHQGMVYRQSLHKDYKGEWDFDWRYKPYEGFKIYMGWVYAIRKAHRELWKLPNLDCPILLLHSDKSSIHTKWNDEVLYTDCVLNVQHMKKLGPQLGDKVELYEVKGGVHDLFLSPQKIRDNAMGKMFSWLKQF